ncbi:MAG: hypothetical protein LBE12_15630 [Planctomycetaceae bacterium]|nr:hypothetical protein [Planctomycetaceae bacterium]
MSQADYYLNDNNSACNTINYPLSTLNYYLALAGLWKRREFLLRRLRFASPPVMHFTPLPGLISQKKNSTDILRKFLFPLFSYVLFFHNISMEFLKFEIQDYSTVLPNLPTVPLDLLKKFR